MLDYKEMYFKLFRATESAINILIAAQQECEDMFISEQPPTIKLVELERIKKKE